MEQNYEVNEMWLKDFLFPVFSFDYNYKGDKIDF